jgi:hypothetical protein
MVGNHREYADDNDTDDDNKYQGFPRSISVPLFLIFSADFSCSVTLLVYNFEKFKPASKKQSSILDEDKSAYGSF